MPFNGFEDELLFINFFKFILSQVFDINFSI